MKRTRARSAGGRATGRGGVQSVTVAARILNALAKAGGRVALKTLAAETGLARAKAHRYLHSLRAAGLVSQQADTGFYQLGPQAIAIGLAALRGVNPVAEVCNALPTLRDKINQTVTAAVWSEAGPILVAMQESDHWLTMNIRIGSRLPVLTTAIGRVFLAYLPELDVAALVAAERKTAQAHGTQLPSADEMHDLTAEIRRRRLARIPSPLVPGIDALAAPVFDFTNKLVAVVCVVARSEAKITGWNGSAVRALADTAAEISVRLGFVEGRAPPNPEHQTTTEPDAAPGVRLPRRS
ncbi:MAG: IclR family transcriptional regulator [Xanthobacteraceae bacterium]|nr:IclR family transcriptional regulator [Xanthobacteraceae bacterium]MBV9632972.1 IclR family transcriptional regulator [Xanthobacteraceae bacterium]